jgi:hypothetical protein
MKKVVFYGSSLLLLPFKEKQKQINMSSFLGFNYNNTFSIKNKGREIDLS